jgi:hypothetical protein
MIESGFLEWFLAVTGIKYMKSGPVLRQKAEEITSKLNIEFMPSSGWHDHSENMQGLATESGVSS